MLWQFVAALLCAMPLLAICKYDFRRHRAAGDGSVRRFGLPRATWFDQLLEKNQLSMQTRDVPLESVDIASCDLVVDVCKGQQYAGILTDWSQEEKFLWDDMQHACDAFSLHTKKIISLPSAIALQRPKKLKSLVWSPCIEARFPWNAQEWSQHSGRSGISHAELVQFFQRPICFAIPSVLVDLMRQGQWSTVMLQARWHSPKRGQAYLDFTRSLGMPTPEWLSMLKKSGTLHGVVAPAPVKFSMSDAAALCNFFRTWAPSILEMCADETLPETKMQIEEFVLRLEAFRQPNTDAQLQKPGGRRQEIHPNTIVKSMCAAMHLRNKSKLSETLKIGLEVALPGLEIDDNFKVPSAPSLSRKQILVDTAYCCYWRSFLEDFLLHGAGPLYLWADSSPQGGTDWLLSIVSFIQASDLHDTAEAADFLVASVDRAEKALAENDIDSFVSLALDRERCGALLKKTIALHRHIPMGLGSGSSSLEHKLQCMLRKLYAESQSMSRLQDLLFYVRSFCTGMGTEMGLPDYKGACIENILPKWMLEPELQSEDVMANGPAQEARDDENVFPNSLLCPGILHICHNMTQEVDASLALWPDWIAGFKCLAHLLHHEHLRKRLVGFCVLNTQFEWMKPVFDKGVPKPISWRWGNVVNILPKMLLFKAPLQAVWNPQRFCQKADDEGSRLGDEDGEHLNMDTLTKAIRSEQWWFFGDMVLHLHKISDEFSSWSEGCACHAWLRSASHPKAGANHKAELGPAAQSLMAARSMLGLSEGDGPNFVCPLAGRRAPELACGAVRSVFEALSQSNLEILLRSCPAVGHAESNAVLSDFSLGRAGMLSYLSQKLHCWSVLPWKLAGLAHFDRATAVKCAESCLQDFDQSPQEPSLHHRLTWKHLKGDAPVRIQMESFVSGADLRDLPDLRALAWELKFLPTVERIQEMDHSIVNRMISNRKVSGPYVSMSLRMPEIYSLMKTSNAEYDKFLAQFQHIFSIDDLAKRMGIFKHPAWHEACAKMVTKKSKTRLAASLLYGLDAEAQFQSMASAKKAREKQDRQQKALEKKWESSFVRQGRFSFQSLEQNAMAVHLRKQLEVGRLYSSPTGAASFPTLHDAMKPLHLQKSQPEPVSLGLEPERLASFMHAGQILARVDDETVEGDPGIVFWRLTCARPSRRKLVRLPAASGTRLSPHDLCVTLHKSVRCQAGCFVDVDPAMAEGLDVPIAILTALKADIATMKTCLFSWSTVKELVFGLVGYESLMSDGMIKLLQDLVHARAFPQERSQGNSVGFLTVEPTQVERVQCLHELQQIGVVQLDNGIESRPDTKVRFTEHGVKLLRHMHKCAMPTLVFTPVAQLAELGPDDWKHCTPWELYTLLTHLGWVLKKAPDARKLKQNPLPPLTIEDIEGQRLTWYTKSVHLEHQVSYMLALLHAQDLFNTSLKALHHCQPAKYYDKVMHKGFDGIICAPQAHALEDALPPALSLDVEADVVVHAEAMPPAIMSGHPADKAIEQLVEHVAASGPDCSEAQPDHTSDSDALSLALFSSPSEPSDTEGADGAALDVIAEGDAVEPLEHVNALSMPGHDAASSAVEVDGLSEIASLNADEDACPVPAGSNVAPKSPPKSSDVVRQVHPDSFDWGPFRLTYVESRKRPCWQARCLFHKKNDATGCKRSMTLGANDSAKDICRRTLMGWCLQAPLHKTKASHCAIPLTCADALDDVILESKLSTLPPVPALVLSDEQIEAEDKKKNSAKPPAKRQSDTKPSAAKRIKAKAKPKETPKGSAKARGSAEAASTSLSSDSPSRGSTSSSSSSSSSSDSD